MTTDFKPGQGAHIRLTALAALLALAACGGNDDDTRPIAESCTTLAGKTVGNGSATITAAELQAATPATGATAQAMPAYCKLSVAARDTGLKLGLWLPTEGWNGKLLMQGGGGFDGAIAAPTANLLVPYMSPSVVGERYAVMAPSSRGSTSPATSTARKRPRRRARKYPPSSARTATGTTAASSRPTTPRTA